MKIYLYRPTLDAIEVRCDAIAEDGKQLATFVSASVEACRHDMRHPDRLALYSAKYTEFELVELFGKPWREVPELAAILKPATEAVK